MIHDESDISMLGMNQKKKNKKKPKKMKEKDDEDLDFILEQCIAENKTWPNQLAKAITTIRRITSQTQSDYFECKADGALEEWPEEVDMKRFRHPDQFNLKEIRFLCTSESCQERLKCPQVRCGVIVANQGAESKILAAPCLNREDDMVAPYQNYSLEFLNDKTEEGAVRYIDFCLECSGTLFYSKNRNKMVGDIPGLKNHAECTLMDTQVPLNKYGRDWKPGPAISNAKKPKPKLF